GDSGNHDQDAAEQAEGVLERGLRYWRFSGRYSRSCDGVTYAAANEARTDRQCADVCDCAGALNRLSYRAFAAKGRYDRAGYRGAGAGGAAIHETGRGKRHAVARDAA